MQWQKNIFLSSRVVLDSRVVPKQQSSRRGRSGNGFESSSKGSQSTGHGMRPCDRGDTCDDADSSKAAIQEGKVAVECGCRYEYGFNLT